jgi:hypothetical protein
MSGLLDSIENTSLADWMRVSEYGYPIILTLHSLGLATVVGVMVLIDLRILGFPKSLPLQSLSRLMRLLWIGLGVNFLTGICLFTADANKFYNSPTFRLKILSLVVGLVLTLVLKGSVFRGAPGQTEPVRPLPKVLAVASILAWLATIGFGRYVAYE